VDTSGFTPRLTKFISLTKNICPTSKRQRLIINNDVVSMAPDGPVGDDQDILEDW
jgi:hypothetical protein